KCAAGRRDGAPRRPQAGARSAPHRPHRSRSGCRGAREAPHRYARAHGAHRSSRRRQGHPVDPLSQSRTARRHRAAAGDGTGRRRRNAECAAKADEPRGRGDGARTGGARPRRREQGAADTEFVGRDWQARHDLSTSSWPGLSRPSRLGTYRLRGDLFVQITPGRIGFRDKTCLPRARPMLHVLLALNGVASGREYFEINELMNVIALCVAFDKAVAMLVDTMNEITGDADVDRATRPAREDIEVELPHAWSMYKRDGRGKPGHDGWEGGAQPRGRIAPYSFRAAPRAMFISARCAIVSARSDCLRASSEACASIAIARARRSGVQARSALVNASWRRK